MFNALNFFIYLSNPKQGKNRVYLMNIKLFVELAPIQNRPIKIKRIIKNQW